MPPPPLFPSPLLPSLAPDTQLSASASGALPPQLPSHSINRIPSSSAMPPPPPLPSLAPDTWLSASAPGALPTQPPSPSTNSIPRAPHKPMMQRGGHVTVHIKMLHLDATQTEQIQQHYDVATNFHRRFSDACHDRFISPTTLLSCSPSSLPGIFVRVRRTYRPLLLYIYSTRRSLYLPNRYSLLAHFANRHAIKI
ncbi:hypothetical protein JB92DRAFT_3103870 [Gautieria morchelliformis]|nr:hypothetical protein JB92DRAFT_3103870 [Gautieria morchelliformis]